jgi:AraC family transcriptional activator of pobA
MDAPSPTFFLYGEPPKSADRRFLHLEPLDDRSRPANWRIKAHRHGDLYHIFLVTGGGGEMRAGAARSSVTAPCLMLVPAGTEHAFTYVPETTGRVLTLSGIFLSDLCRIDEALGALLSEPAVVQAGAEAGALLGHFDRLGRELAWQAPGHAAAVKATLLHIMVLILRLQRQGAAPDLAECGDRRLIARFRELVEARFRSHVPIGTYAVALGASLSRLRSACRSQGCGAPVDIVNARRMVEAKRALVYGVSSVAEIAFSLGYDDVSYFVRLFRRLEGTSPRKFRHATLVSADQAVAAVAAVGEGDENAAARAASCCST